MTESSNQNDPLKLLIIELAKLNGNLDSPGKMFATGFYFSLGKTLASAILWSIIILILIIIIRFIVEPSFVNYLSGWLIR